MKDVLFCFVCCVTLPAFADDFVFGDHSYSCEVLTHTSTKAQLQATYFSCALPNTNSYVDIVDFVEGSNDAASQLGVTSDIDGSTPILFIAKGGGGGNGHALTNDHDGGSGGVVVVGTTFDQYANDYSTTNFHWYVGDSGDNNIGDGNLNYFGSGGAPTFITTLSADVVLLNTSQGFNIYSTIAIAGGGGGARGGTSDGGSGSKTYSSTESYTTSNDVAADSANDWDKFGGYGGGADGQSSHRTYWNNDSAGGFADNIDSYDLGEGSESSGSAGGGGGFVGGELGYAGGNFAAVGTFDLGDITALESDLDSGTSLFKDNGTDDGEANVVFVVDIGEYYGE